MLIRFESDGSCIADLEFYKDCVAFAKKHNIFLLSDLAYSEIYFDGNPPPSMLQVNGAMDVAVEFTSMSKSFSMPGWRIGFAVGNERLISALARVKSYLDYGAYTPIQVAAAAALNGPEAKGCINEIRETVYKKRRDALVETCSKAAPAERAGAERPPMFAWVPIPQEFKALGSVEFSKPSHREGASISRCRPARASANTAMAMNSCVSRSSKTSSASARPRATSAASSKRPKSACTM